MKIRTGDTVYAISGKDKGKSGKVLRVLTTKGRVVVEGINIRTRHIKKTTQGPGQRLKYEAGLSLSNVMILDPKTKKPTRIGYKLDAKGAKVRFAKVSGEIIPEAATVKAETKKSPKKTKSPKSPANEEKVAPVSSEASTSTQKPPAKQAFWKRAFSGNPQDIASSTDNRTNQEASNPATQVHRTNES